MVRDESITPKTGRKLDRVIILSLGVAVALLLGDRLYNPQSAPDAHQPTIQATDAIGTTTMPDDSGVASVAVLPFVNMSDDQQNEYFSDGISEELLNVLVRVEGLRVPSRTSSFTFKGSDKKLSEIGHELQVDHVLEGSVRKSGDRAVDRRQN